VGQVDNEPNTSSETTKRVRQHRDENARRAYSEGGEYHRLNLHMGGLEDRFIDTDGCRKCAPDQKAQCLFPARSSVIRYNDGLRRALRRGYRYERCSAWMASIRFQICLRGPRRRVWFPNSFAKANIRRWPLHVRGDPAWPPFDNTAPTSAKQRKFLICGRRLGWAESTAPGSPLSQTIPTGPSSRPIDPVCAGCRGPAGHDQTDAQISPCVRD